ELRRLGCRHHGLLSRGDHRLRSGVRESGSGSFTLRRPMDYDTEVTVRAAGWIDVLLGGETYVPGPRVRGAKAACRAVIAEVEDFLF
ncbi:hypothetical protein, partial [Cellulosimicrobium sp. NPDC057862]|uniref:hypothetical protein n=1 Tax=Cellulosimicrobium sp. NPDC057862 TaxID=3346266 RepID=UPI003671E0B0